MAWGSEGMKAEALCMWGSQAVPLAAETMLEETEDVLNQPGP